ncbi:response regulator [Magnetococcus sp. PR-3]|uniref:response regulator n=1 Tax=Magnetococcus sp. PR-3 TaxID=3120355 RepID=UPI002FCE0FD5
MGLVHRLSIHQKLTLMAVGASLIALLFSASTYMARDYWGRRDALEKQYHIQAQLMAQTLQATLVFNDAQSASDMMAALGADSEVHSAWLYDLSGTVFSRYVRKDLVGLPPPTPGSIPMSGHRFGQHLLDLALPVKLQDERVGLFYLRVDLRRYRALLGQDLTLTLLFLVLSASAAYLIARRMHRTITTPIQALAAVAQRVAINQDYAARAPEIHTNDELHLLVDGFNGMLNEIGRQDEALRQHRDSLEVQVEARTVELTDLNHALAEARDQALESARLKSAFLATMSHEIRTPMNGVVGMLELLDEKSLSHQQQEYVSIAKHSSEALLNIINDILDFSKVEAGHLELESIPFNPLQEMEEVVALLAPRAHNKGVALVVKAQWETLPAIVKGDPLRFRQVLTNLIGNAIKFTHKGEVEMFLSWQGEPDATGELHFSVKDTGVGIDEQAQKRLFQVFTQADGSTTRNFGGTGLGLAISRQLIELQGGDIGVESQLGQGARFFFHIPLNGAEKLILEESLLSTHALPQVWLLEAHPSTCTALEEMLSALGVSYQKLDGMATLQQQWQHLTDDQAVPLVLMDLSYSDTPELAQMVHTQVLTSPTAWIAMMGAAVQLEGARHQLGSSVAYLSKPVRLGELVRLLQHELQNTHVVPVDDEKPALEGQVLLVEDNKVNQKVALGMLQPLGVEVQVASSGKEAIEYVQNQNFDLILMDLHMPQMGGLEATQILREQAKAGEAHLPIVALTATDHDADRQQALNVGMDGFVSKPLHLSDLKKVLNQWLGNKREEVETVGLEKLFSESALNHLQSEQAAQRQHSHQLLQLWMHDCHQSLHCVGTLLDQPHRPALKPLIQQLNRGALQVGLIEMVPLFEQMLYWIEQPNPSPDTGISLMQQLLESHKRLQQGLLQFA